MYAENGGSHFWRYVIYSLVHQGTVDDLTNHTMKLAHGTRKSVMRSTGRPPDMNTDASSKVCCPVLTLSDPLIQLLPVAHAKPYLERLRFHLRECQLLM